MAITRTPIVDDDGTRTTGTVLNNAWKQEIYDQVDAADAASVLAGVGGTLAVQGTWTPADGSGAGLTFTVVTANYYKIGKLVHIDAQIVYPATANGATAKISGLPFTPAGRSALSNANSAVDIRLAITNGAAVIEITSNVGAIKTNAQMTGANFYLSGTFISST